MKILKILAFVFLVLFGAFAIVFGEYDDSPGAQGLGLIAVITGLVYLYKILRKK